MKKVIAGLFLVLLFGCGQASKEKTNDTPDTQPPDTSSSVVQMNPDIKTVPFAASPDNERVQMLIASARQTMDSIDLAYDKVRTSSKMLNLSLDDREKLNEALEEMNMAKELILLETHKQIIDELNEKSLSLNNVVGTINAKSEEMRSVCQTIRWISEIIKKTTDLFATALTAGIVKPRMN